MIASHNDGKLREIRELMVPFGFEARSAGESAWPEPEETGTTFEENAYIKALAAAPASGLPALSDDSGLVRRRAGWRARRLHRALGGTRGKDFGSPWRRSKTSARARRRTAARRTAAHSSPCSASPGRTATRIFPRRKVEGTLVWPPRGDKGFGYDPVFLPDGHTRTFGEMTARRSTVDARGEGCRTVRGPSGSCAEACLGNDR